jgi:hypothetical protein
MRILCSHRFLGVSRAATLDYAALKCVEVLCHNTWTRHADTAVETLLPECEQILQAALDPKDEAANKDTIAVFLTLYSRRGAALSPFSANVKPEVMRVCVAVAQFAQQLVERGSTIKPDSTDPAFRFYVAQLYNCTFALTKAIIVRSYIALPPEMTFATHLTFIPPCSFC